MSKRKAFSISSNLSRGITETVSLAENHSGYFRNAVVPLSRLELDPDNPRKMALTLDDVTYGLKNDDPNYHQKEIEYEALKGLAKTITANGLIQPIAIYKYHENYRIVAGHRRFLASLMAGKTDIEARIFNEKPKKFELKLVQLIENTQRENLSLADRLNNIRDLITEYQNEHHTEVNATILHNLTGLSLTQAKSYLYVLKGSQELLQAIKNGTINSLDKAVLIANATDSHLSRQALNACEKGASLAEIRKLFTTAQAIKVEQKKLAKTTSIAQAKSGVNLGRTFKSEVVRAIVHALVKQPGFEQYASLFIQIDWTNHRQVTKAFQHLIKLLENQI